LAIRNMGGESTAAWRAFLGDLDAHGLKAPLSWQMQHSGLLTATARLVAQGEAVASATATGTPAEPALKRFGHFNGSITRNGTALGNVVSAEITYANNLDRIGRSPMWGSAARTRSSLFTTCARCLSASSSSAAPRSRPPCT
jgi:hypothetical protein